MRRGRSTGSGTACNRTRSPPLDSRRAASQKSWRRTCWPTRRAPAPVSAVHGRWSERGGDWAPAAAYCRRSRGHRFGRTRSPLISCARANARIGSAAPPRRLTGRPRLRRLIDGPAPRRCNRPLPPGMDGAPYGSCLRSHRGQHRRPVRAVRVHTGRGSTPSAVVLSDESPPALARRRRATACASRRSLVRELIVEAVCEVRRRRLPRRVSAGGAPFVGRRELFVLAAAGPPRRLMTC